MRWILFFIAASLLCCQKEKEKSPYIGEAYALMDNKPWYAYTYLAKHEKDSNRITLVTAVADEEYEDIVREELIFYNLKLREGIYFLDTMHAPFFKTHFGVHYVTSVDDGDVTGDELWSPRQNSENYVIVDSYDTTTCDLVGRFHFYLVFSHWRPKFDPSLPDTLWFRDGRFNVKIKK